MVASKHRNILSALEQFHNELKSYKGLLEHLAESKMTMGHEIRERDELKERLVRKSGALKGIIIELTGKEYFVQFMNKYNMWSEAFNILLFSAQGTALTFCINATNEAIGRLESDIELGIRDRQGKIIEKPPKLSKKPAEDTGEMASYLFDKMQFHPRIIRASKSLFRSGHYAEAIFAAFKAVNNFTKRKTGQSLDGKDLMAKVFNEDKPIIKLNKLVTRSERDEQEGFRFLYMGAMVGIRNPKAHDDIRQIDPYKALEYLAFASLLMRRVIEGKLEPKEQNLD